MTASRVAASAPAACLFLRACSIAEADDWEEHAQLVRSLDSTDWKHVARLAKMQGLVGLAARNLAWARLRLGVEIPIVDSLEALRRDQLVQLLARRSAAKRVAERLDDRALPFVAFKGFVLAEEIYGDLSLRSFGDFDILVREEDLDEAYEILVAHGYRPRYHEHVRDWVRQGAHAVGLHHEDGTSVDLHWAIAPDLRTRSAVATAWEHARPAPPGAELPGLRFSPELTLVHLAKHFHSHHYRELRPLVDFHTSARRLGGELDVAALRQVARALGRWSTVEIAVALCGRSLGSRGLPAALQELRPAVPARLARYVITDAFLVSAGRFPEVVNWLRYVIAAGSISASLRAVVRVVVPDRSLLSGFFRRPFHPSMYPLYYWRQLVKVVTLATK